MSGTHPCYWCYGSPTRLLHPAVFGNSCMFSCLRPGFRVEPFGNAFVSCEGGGRWSHDVLEIRCVGKWTLDSAGIDFQEIFCVIFHIGRILGAHNLLGLFSNSKICWLISETCIFTDIHHMCLSCSTHTPHVHIPMYTFLSSNSYCSIVVFALVFILPLEYIFLYSYSLISTSIIVDLY